MPEVERMQTRIVFCGRDYHSNSILQAQQTATGEYTYYTWHFEPAKDHDRFMSWKGGNGRIGIGVNGVLTSRGTDKDEENVCLSAGNTVIVIDTAFKITE